MLLLVGAMAVICLSIALHRTMSRRPAHRSLSLPGGGVAIAEQEAVTASQVLSDAVAENLVLRLCTPKGALAETNELFDDLARTDPLWWLDALPDW